MIGVVIICWCFIFGLFFNSWIIINQHGVGSRRVPEEDGGGAEKAVKRCICR